MVSISSFPEYYHSYLNELDDEFSIQEANVNEVLAVTYELVFDLFAQLYPEQKDYAYEEGKWTIAELFGHLIDTERIFTYRALRIARGDLHELKGFDENKYAKTSNYHLRSFDSIKQEFLALLESTGYFFEGLTEKELEMNGTANGVKLTPRKIGFLIAAHRCHHYKILKERYL